jgi:hypothetical protein
VTLLTTGRILAFLMFATYLLGCTGVLDGWAKCLKKGRR